MQIQFLGAAGEVTGSCHLLTIGGRRVLLDCGLIQGGRRDETRNEEAFSFDPAALDAVILSHAHIDHSGRLPLLVKRGFKGPIYTHYASLALCEIMLRDAAFINEKDAEWDNRKRERKGLEPVSPLYTRRDAERAMRQFVGMPYRERRQIVPGLDLSLFDAGHILGSAIVQLDLEEHGRRCKLVFSGDLGHAGAAIMHDPAVLHDADLVILESTYGDRLHRTHQATLDEMHEVLQEALASGGKVLIPAFAIGRTQELLHLFSQFYTRWGVDRWRLYLDSPLAIEATEIYLRHSELFDDEAKQIFARDRHLPLLPNLEFSRTAAQSMALNRIRSGAIIIAGSGMCTGGRIKHHLKHNVWRPDCHIVIVGFQAHGTLGRQLVDGAKHIRLWGETLKVNARVHTLGGFSAHADAGELSRWYGNFTHRPPVVLVHGEPEAQQALASRLQSERGVQAHIAERHSIIELPPA